MTDSRAATAQREGAALVAVGLLVAIGILLAVRGDHRELRDGIRREHLASLKHALELINNDTGAYPAPPDAPQTQCAPSTDPHDWFFGQRRAAYIRRHVSMIPRDPQSPDTWAYTYCVVAVDGRGATAWYLRAQLERRQAPRAAFDAEEGHNFFARVVREDGATFYDICGGTLRCGVPPGVAGAPP